MPPAKVFGKRVREARKRKNWTQKQLAERLAGLGQSFDQSRVAKVENGQIALTPLRDVFAFAMALDVAPIHLIVPLEDEMPAEITPKYDVPAPVAREWIRGNAPLPRMRNYPGTDMRMFLAERAEEEVRQMIRTALRGKVPATPLEALLLGGDAPVPREVEDWIYKRIRSYEGREEDDG
jgi:transcriptional regulator with XRE-family HTH domain